MTSQVIIFRTTGSNTLPSSVVKTLQQFFREMTPEPIAVNSRVLVGDKVVEPGLGLNLNSKVGTSPDKYHGEPLST